MSKKDKAIPAYDGINVDFVEEPFKERDIINEENHVDGLLVQKIEDLIIKHTPGPIEGSMAVAITMAFVVTKFLSGSDLHAAEHNIDQLCKAAKKVAKNIIEGEQEDKPPESHVFN